MAEKEKLLVIDDDQTITATMEHLLKDHYEIDVALSGQTGMQALESNEYPLAFLDIILPDISGMDILKHVKDKGIPTEIIMLTGNSDTDVAVDTMKAGAFDYVSKPFTFERLDACVTKALAAYKTKIRVITREQVLAALKEHDGHHSRVAEVLQVDLDFLYKKITEYNIGPREIV